MEKRLKQNKNYVLEFNFQYFLKLQFFCYDFVLGQSKSRTVAIQYHEVLHCKRKLKLYYITIIFGQRNWAKFILFYRSQFRCLCVNIILYSYSRIKGSSGKTTFLTS